MKPLQDFDITAEPTEQPPLLQEENLVGSLDELDVDNALLRHYYRVERLARDVLTDPDIPPNQQAAVMNTLNSLLVQIAKTRTELYTAERMKRIEQTLLFVLKTLPKQQQQDFLEEYERELRRTP
jgi:hypothetical protein